MNRQNKMWLKFSTASNSPTQWLQYIHCTIDIYVMWINHTIKKDFFMFRHLSSSQTHKNWSPLQWWATPADVSGTMVWLRLRAEPQADTDPAYLWPSAHRGARQESETGAGHTGRRLSAALCYIMEVSGRHQTPDTYTCTVFNPLWCQTVRGGESGSQQGGKAGLMFGFNTVKWTPPLPWQILR